MPHSSGPLCTSSLSTLTSHLDIAKRIALDKFLNLQSMPTHFLHPVSAPTILVHPPGKDANTEYCPTKGNWKLTQIKCLKVCALSHTYSLLGRVNSCCHETKIINLGRTKTVEYFRGIASHQLKPSPRHVTCEMRSPECVSREW